MDIRLLLVFPTIFLIFLFGFVLYLVYKLDNEKVRIYRYREAITKSYNDFLSIYEKDRYFSKRDLKKWLNENKTVQKLTEECMEYEEKIKIYDNLLKIFQPIINTKFYGFDDDFKRKILHVSNVFKNGNEIREKRNDYYIKEELEIYDVFFSNVCSKPLSEEQRRIIVTEEAHNLVVAGAGTGKTMTIVGKTGYLLKKRIVEPDELLLLSFAKKARDEMIDRTQRWLNSELEVRTFHSLGLEITRNSR